MSGGHTSGAEAIFVRPARDSDVEALVALLGELFSIEEDFEPHPPRQRRGLALMLAEPRARVVVAERGGTVVGMATGQLVISTAEGAPSAWIEDVVVARGARGSGVGRRLVEAVVAWAGELGATRCQLLVDRQNVPALRFYSRIGWTPTQLACVRRPPCR